jgi:molybdopterin-guanine dinucleotide biosynthesis protein
MTTSTAIKKFLERKEAKLTAVLALEKNISDLERQRDKHIIEQRAAVDALVAEGFTRAELKQIGIVRRRRPANEAPASRKSRENSAGTPEPPSYDEKTLNSLTESDH